LGFIGGSAFSRSFRTIRTQFLSKITQILGKKLKKAEKCQFLGGGFEDEPNQNDELYVGIFAHFEDNKFIFLGTYYNVSVHFSLCANIYLFTILSNLLITMR